MIIQFNLFEIIEKVGVSTRTNRPYKFLLFKGMQEIQGKLRDHCYQTFELTFSDDESALIREEKVRKDAQGESTSFFIQITKFTSHYQDSVGAKARIYTSAEGEVRSALGIDESAYLL